jgi:catechol 2,3-dioxygenase-like lactoylglutathione lyase family enzyme
MQRKIGRRLQELERACLTRRRLIASLGLVAVGGSVGRALGQDQSKKAATADSTPTFRAVDLNHIALNVSDVQRSQAWYRKHLGLRPMENQGFLTTGKGWLALFKGAKPGLNHYCYSIVDYDPDRVVAKLRAAGLTPRRQADRVYFDDPDGIECQLGNAIAGDRPVQSAAEPGATFQAVDLNHIALNVTDVKRSRQWYEKHLGLKVTREDGERACFLTTGKGWLALFKGPRPGLNHYCYSVDAYDPAEVVAKLNAAKLTPKRRENRVYFDDPDGLECQLAKTIAK